MSSALSFLEVSEAGSGGKYNVRSCQCSSSFHRRQDHTFRLTISVVGHKFNFEIEALFKCESQCHFGAYKVFHTGSA